MATPYPTELVTNYFKARAAAYTSPMGLKALLDRQADEIVVIDVRLPGPQIAWRIPGSMVIPAPEMAARVGELPSEKLIVLYCWDTWCSLAATAALPLLERGYRVQEMHGGVAAWQALGLPRQAEASAPEPSLAGAC
jgi:rhodanese-related sulfurtransferase